MSNKKKSGKKSNAATKKGTKIPVRQATSKRAATSQAATGQAARRRQSLRADTESEGAKGYARKALLVIVVLLVLWVIQSVVS